MKTYEHRNRDKTTNNDDNTKAITINNNENSKTTTINNNETNNDLTNSSDDNNPIEKVMNRMLIISFCDTF